MFEPQCRWRSGQQAALDLDALASRPKLFDQAALVDEGEVALDGLMHVGARDVVGGVVILARIERLVPVRHLDGGLALVVMPVFRLPQRLVMEVVGRLDVERAS